ncbi:BAR domain-containing protein [Blastocladiella britannica]|nr:BAR domain-containing protein [Blastocladiella britannica]
MSWKGFTKAVNRAGTSLMQTVGTVDKTVDREFEDEERRFRSLEGKIEKLHRESKGYLDTLRALSLAQSRMAATIEAFYDDSAAMCQPAREYVGAIQAIEAEERDSFDVAYRTTVLDPLGRFCEYFPDYNEAIKKRGHKLLDYDAARTRHRKLAESPSPDATRLPAAEQEVGQARAQFEALNAPLKEELPRLVSLRTTYLEPTFEALVALQYAYLSDSYARLQNLDRALAHAGIHGADNPDMLDRTLEGVVEQPLLEMRELSIVTGTIKPAAPAATGTPAYGAPAYGASTYGGAQ